MPDRPAGSDPPTTSAENAPAAGAPADAGRAPRRRSVTRWTALLIGLVVVAGTGYALAATAPEPQPGYLRYLAVADGPVLATVVGTDGSATSVLTVSTVVSGALPAAHGLPGPILSERVYAALDAAGLDPDLRLVDRVLVSDGSPDPGTTGSVTALLRLQTGYVEVGTADLAGRTLWYEPPLPVLPADPGPGVTWTGEGVVNGVAPYRVEGSVAAAEGADGERGCLEVTLRVERVAGGSAGSVRSTRSLRCPGTGEERVEDLTDGTSTTVVRSPPGAVGGTGEAVTTDGETTDGETTDGETTDGETTDGETTAGWTAATWPTPLHPPLPSSTVALAPVTVGGRVVVADAVSGDLLALRLPSAAELPATVQEWGEPRLALDWLQHPGGTVLGLATDGIRVLAATAARRLVALSSDGGWLWSTALPDAPVGPPAVTGSVVTVALADGTVLGLAVRSGEVLWQDGWGDTIDAAPVAEDRAAGPADRVVVVGDTAGAVGGFRPSGRRAWSAQLPGAITSLTATGDGSVIATDAGGGAFRLGETGTEWVAALPVVPAGPGAAAGSVALLPSSTAVLAVATADGAIDWRIDDLEDPRVASAGGTLYLAAGDRLMRLDPDGRVLADEPFGAGDVTVDDPVLLAAAGDGVIAVDRSGAVRSWAGSA